MPDYRRYLSPEVVSQLASMDLVARLVVEGFITGLHQSPYHGFSVEFAEHRQYMPGDPVGDIDWKAYAKSDRLYVKEYEEETNLKAYILLDCSGSMGFASPGCITKFDYGSYLAAALTYLMLRQRDAVGLVTFAGGIRRYIPPRSVRSHLSLILKELEACNVSAETRAAQTFHEVAERISRRGLIIVISDLLDDPAQTLLGLKHFRHKGHEVLVFHVLDPRERDFGFDREARFVDLETGEEMLTQPWHIRRAYQSLMAQMIHTYQRGCRESRIEYVPMDTSQHFGTALLRYLAKRKTLA